MKYINLTPEEFKSMNDLIDAKIGTHDIMELAELPAPALIEKMEQLEELAYASPVFEKQILQFAINALDLSSVLGTDEVWDE